MTKIHMGGLQNQIGFTLVELIIVMLLISFTLGLVGPLTIRSIDRAAAKTELLTLKKRVKHAGNMAFWLGRPVTLKFIGHQVSYYGLENSSTEHSYNFDYLFFQPQEVIFSAKGISDSAQLKVQFKGEDQVVDIQDKRAYRVDVNAEL